MFTQFFYYYSILKHWKVVIYQQSCEYHNFCVTNKGRGIFGNQFYPSVHKRGPGNEKNLFLLHYQYDSSEYFLGRI